MIIEMKNSEILKAIDETYKSEKNRAILRDRIFNMMSYDSIIDKYFNGNDLPKSVRKRIKKRMSKMLLKIMKKCEKRGTDETC